MMNRAGVWLAIVTYLMLFPLDAESQWGRRRSRGYVQAAPQQRAPQTYEELAPLGPDEWYSRDVDVKRHVVVSYLSWGIIVDGVFQTRRRPILTENLPRDYRPVKFFRCFSQECSSHFG